MNVKERYTLYTIANHLVSKEGYELLHLNENTGELWLEKYTKQVTNIIRLTTRGFDWKNHLKQDIAQVFQRVLQMKGFLRGKNFDVSNVYITSYSPVDHWEELKKPMKLKDKTSIMMHVYYVDLVHENEELTRLQEDLNLEPLHMKTSMPEEEIVIQTNNIQHRLQSQFQKHKSEQENIMAHGKPILTYLILAINIIIYFLVELNGGSQSVPNLIRFGAKYNPAIVDGEWWRIVSSMFIHIGFIHLFMNMLAIYYLGTLVERIYGSFRYFAIYFLAGIGGGIASFAFTNNVSAGASGALFGLFGALLFFGLHYRQLFFKTMGQNVIMLIIINIVFGFLVPQIDNSAHVGGLLTGFVAAGIVHLPRKNRNWQTQMLAIVVYAFIISGLGYYGIDKTLQSAPYQWEKVTTLIQSEQYDEVIRVTTEALNHDPGDLKAPLLFQRSYAYIKLQKETQAIEDLEYTVKVDPSMPEAYYNLALLYYDQGHIEQAKDAIKTAHELDPIEDQYQDFYNKLWNK
ncbi:rhomboid family intramembrane serine protease [Virgibacillus soli]|uniref:rhomboid family intramembrane serine protease n=1 Tax=Paracerasibacillus soli TaxID=480284 RepID=UPI0035E56550